MANWYDEYIEEARNPDWETFDKKHMRVHEWETYITDEVRENWNDICLLGRCAIIACCQSVADNEDWD